MKITSTDKGKIICMLIEDLINCEELTLVADCAVVDESTGERMVTYSIAGKIKDEYNVIINGQEQHYIKYLKEK